MLTMTMTMSLSMFCPCDKHNPHCHRLKRSALLSWVSNDVCKHFSKRKPCRLFKHLWSEELDFSKVSFVFFFAAMDSRDLWPDGKHPKGPQWISVSHKQSSICSSQQSDIKNMDGKHTNGSLECFSHFLHVLVRRWEGARGPRAHLRTCDAACD